MKILHLTLKRQWFDMIASGEKKEEYREIKPYWASRLLYGMSKSDISFDLSELGQPLKTNAGETLFDSIKKDFDAIKFTNGYAKNAPTFLIELNYISMETGFEHWGAEADKKYFVLKLGAIINHT